MIVVEEEEEKNKVTMIKYVVYLHSVMIYLFTEITNEKTCNELPVVDQEQVEREREGKRKKASKSRKHVKV